jgi:hypothetical protein
MNISSLSNKEVPVVVVAQLLDFNLAIWAV